MPLAQDIGLVLKELKANGFSVREWKPINWRFWVPLWTIRQHGQAAGRA